jgi:hypothetical protein
VEFNKSHSQCKASLLSQQVYLYLLEHKRGMSGVGIFVSILRAAYRIFGLTCYPSCSKKALKRSSLPFLSKFSSFDSGSRFSFVKSTRP